MTTNKPTVLETISADDNSLGDGLDIKDQRRKHYEIDEPLQMQFDKISVSIHGGLECGKYRCIQPSIGSLKMDVVSKSYMMTPKALKASVDWLNGESVNINDASALHKLARAFVNRISKPVTKGGMMNVGEFWAVVLLQVLPILGLIPAEFITCSCFARDSGVASFLLGEYELILKDDRLLDVSSRKQYFKQRFGSMNRVVVENLICEMKRHRDARCDGDNNFNGGRYFEFLRNDRNAIFAEGVVDGNMSVVDHDGKKKAVNLVLVEPNEDESLDISLNRDDRITMVVSHGTLNQRTDKYNWWSNRPLEIRQCAPLDLNSFPSLHTKFGIGNFSSYLSLNSERLFDFSREVTTINKVTQWTEKRNECLKMKRQRKLMNKKGQVSSRLQPVKDHRSENWGSNPHISKSQSMLEKKRNEIRALMKQLLIFVDLSEIDCIDASEVTGRSLNDVVERLLRLDPDDNSLLDHDVSGLISRLKSNINNNDEDDVDRVEPTKRDDKTANVKDLLKKVIANDDETFVPTRRLSTRHTIFIKKLSSNIPRFEVFLKMEKQDCTASVPLDIESILAMMVDPLDVRFVINKQSYQLCCSNAITIYSCSIIDSQGGNICTSADGRFFAKTERGVKKRLTQKGSASFTIDAIPEMPGFYLTEMHAKLSALASYVIEKLGHARGAMLFERLFPRAISILYPIDDTWSESIAVESVARSCKMPIIAVVRNSDAIIFIDLHQLAYMDMLHKETEAIQIPDNIDYCTTTPSLWSIRQMISPDDLCVIVGFTTDIKCNLGFPKSRMKSAKYIYGDDVIPDGTIEVDIKRIKGVASDSYYILPKTNVKLRSKQECKEYSECLKAQDGDEHLALAEFWQKKDMKNVKV